MILHRSEKWWNAALARAERTVAQTFLSILPAGIVITPTMLKEANYEIAYVITAWIITALFGGLTSLLTSYVKGIPEAED